MPLKFLSKMNSVQKHIPVDILQISWSEKIYHIPQETPVVQYFFNKVAGCKGATSQRKGSNRMAVSGFMWI